MPQRLFCANEAVSVELWVSTGSPNCCDGKIFGWGSGSNLLTVMYSQFGHFVGGSSIAGWQTVGIYFNGQQKLQLVITVFPGRHVLIYLSGVLYMNTTFPLLSTPSPDFFTVGSMPSSNWYYGLVGSVDEVRIWQGALSQAEIATRYSQGPGNSCCCCCCCCYYCYCRCYVSCVVVVTAAAAAVVLVVLVVSSYIICFADFLFYFIATN